MVKERASVRFDVRPAQLHRLLLASLLLTYLVLATLYAVYTPPWQVPDEPAHYNYVRAIAQQGRLPVMEHGDYDQAYLERLTGERFPPELSIEPVTYEDHQPPLYYLLAVPLYLLFDGALLPLRLFSVGLGLLLLLLVHGVVRELFPTRSSPALVAVGLVALLPQHLAMMAGVENDALAEVLVAGSLWAAVRYVAGRGGGHRFLLGWGSLLGLVLLTKVSAYVALPVALLALAMRARRAGWDARRTAAQAGRLLLPASLIALPWLLRNVSLYGWSDPLAMVRHNAVVEGQPRTAEWLARYGPVGLATRFLRTTFHSFWGQFGWMGVPLPGPFYGVLLLLSALPALGFIGWLFDRRRPRLDRAQVDGLRLLGLSAALSLLLYLVYNVTFVQHQGRYLFPALVPIALGVALGLEWLLARRMARRAAAGLAGAAVLFVVVGLVRGDVAFTHVAGALGLAALFGLAAVWPRWGRTLALLGLGLGLVGLNVYSLFWAIVPQLATG